MGWPTPQEYNEAIQNPRHNLADEELRAGSVVLDTFGLPRVASGNFASVYQIHCANRSMAVRCFLHDLSDQAQRYAQIAAFVMADTLPCTVSFEYVHQGILVHGNWFPILKMEWVEGVPLDQYVRTYHSNSQRISKLADQFTAMVLDLQRAGIAHGDLQHGNILVIDDGEDLRLVDYDGMFVPGLAGSTSNELGHRNFQHPARSMNDFWPGLDNFSAWSIYTSLACIAADGSLVASDKACDESLLFRQSDYRNPIASSAFSVLENHAKTEIRTAARCFRTLLSKRIRDIPALSEEVHIPHDLPPLCATPFFSIESNLPDWMKSIEPISPTLKPVAANSGASAENAPEKAAAHSVSIQRAEPALPAKAGSPIHGEWPTASLYLAAFKEPRESLCRFPDLADAVFPVINGEVQHIATPTSLIVPVYVGTSAYALKVFLAPDKARTARFQAVSRILQGASAELLDYLTPFEYFESGIKVRGQWYPLIRMPWLGGVTLQKVLMQQSYPTKAKQTLLGYARNLRRAMEALDANGLVHGDIEPSNMMIVGKELKLIDYDNMHPAGSGIPCPLPNENYRHPRQVSPADTGSDNFSAWLVDTTLMCLACSDDMDGVQKPTGDLFSRDDLEHPTQSSVFHRMETDSDALINNRSLLLRLFLTHAPADIPPLRSSTAINADYAEKHSLPFNFISPTRVSPDARYQLKRLTALGEAVPYRFPSRASGNQQSKAADRAIFAVLSITIVVCYLLAMAFLHGSH